jgi:hypothetical protein
VAARLPAILRRLNPAGEHIAPRAAGPTPRAWIEAIETALGPGARPSRRRAAALDAVRIARAEGWTDHRRAFSHFALGRLVQAEDPDFARVQFVLADRFYSTVPGTALHRAYVAAQLASHAIARGDGIAALGMLEPQVAVAERFGRRWRSRTASPRPGPRGWTVWAGRVTATGRSGPCRPGFARWGRSALSGDGTDRR